MKGDGSMLDETRPCMLTTIDNPFNPFTQWESWLRYDRDNGYYTNEYLARIADTDIVMSENQTASAIKKAMTEIVENNPTNMGVLVYEPTNKQQ